jgi:hypothetical protein
VCGRIAELVLVENRVRDFFVKRFFLLFDEFDGLRRLCGVKLGPCVGMMTMSARLIA